MRQYMVYFGSYINETSTRQYMVPGGAYVNETVAAGGAQCYPFYATKG